MKREWIKVEDRLPESGQEILTYYYDVVSERDQIDLLTYFKKDDTMYTKIDRDPDKTKIQRIISTVFNKDLEVKAPEDGFYIYERIVTGKQIGRAHV